MSLLQQFESQLAGKDAEIVLLTEQLQQSILQAMNHAQAKQGSPRSSPRRY